MPGEPGRRAVGMIWRFLIVNDGSTDRSAELAAVTEALSETFRVIHKENGGHGSTINRGIKEASGTYFLRLWTVMTGWFGKLWKKAHWLVKRGTFGQCGHEPLLV